MMAIIICKVCKLTLGGASLVDFHRCQILTQSLEKAPPLRRVGTQKEIKAGLLTFRHVLFQRELSMCPLVVQRICRYDLVRLAEQK